MDDNYIIFIGKHLYTIDPTIISKGINALITFEPLHGRIKRL